MEIEGAPTKRFKLIRTDREGNPARDTETLCESDDKASITAWLEANPRRDWHYRVWDRRTKLTLTEFGAS